ncbi:DUF6531 domain-containing protein [Myxococcus stipitatus]|uniref:DUF6531 domain-containing protein n=1 Tax=Myxococcus stipitatus TaxID=83455 RepID=UPI0030CAD9AE
MAVGHPVDVASGALFNHWVDLHLPGSMPLLIERYYSTALLKTPATPELLRARVASGLRGVAAQEPGRVHLHEGWIPASSVAVSQPGALACADFATVSASSSRPRR